MQDWEAREQAGANLGELGNRRRARGRQLSTEYTKGCDWFDDHDEVLAFARALDEGDGFTSTGDVLYYFEKPWKWTEDRDAWINQGEPDAFDPEWRSR